MSNLSIDHAKLAEMWEGVCSMLWKGERMFGSGI